jgi:hypothetical protein
MSTMMITSAASTLINVFGRMPLRIPDAPFRLQKGAPFSSSCPHLAGAAGRQHIIFWMKGARIIALLALALSSLVMLIRPAQATPAQQANLRVSMTVDAGFNSYYKARAWIPLRVTLVNAGDPIEGRVVIHDKRFAIAARFTQEVSLGRNARRTVVLYAPAMTDAFDVQLISGDTVIAAITPVVRELASGDRLALIASDPPDAFNFIGDVRTANGSTTALASLRLDQLPDHSAALDAADVIIFSGVDTSQLTQAQRNAIESWVAGGGHLMLAGGPSAQLAFGGFTNILPSRAGVALVNTSPEALGGLATPASLFQLAPVPTQTIAVSRLQLDVPGARALAGSPETPLIVRRDFGRGLVDQLAFDPSLAPLRDWDGRSALFAALFNGRSGLSNDIGTRVEDDVEGAQTAASALEAASPPSAFVVAGFFALYVLVIGPLNFLILRRFKRQAWAWLSIPAIVIAFTVLGLLTGFRLRGNNPQVHRLSVTLGDSAGDNARSYSLYGLFAPRRADVDFEVGRALPQALSEPLDPEQPQLSVDVDFGDPTRVRQVPLTNSDVRTLYARNGGLAQPLMADLSYAPGAAGVASAINGTLRNDSPYALSMCVLMAGKDYQSIGDLPANGGSAAVKLNLLINHPQSLIDLRSMNDARDRLFIGRTFGNSFNRTAPPASSSPSSASTTDFPFEQNGAPITDAMVNWHDFGEAGAQQEAYFGLIASVFGSESVGAGVFVGCWETRDTTSAVIDGADYTDGAARIWRVPVKGHVAGNGESLPPEVFAWNVVATSSNSELNDDGMLFDPGEHILSLSPWFDLRTSAVTATVALNLEFNVNASSLQGLRDTSIALYNWQTRAYDRVIDQADDSASQNVVAGPYVSPSGQVMMKLSVNSESITLNRIAPRVEMTP